jgi:hypothetical protein
MNYSESLISSARAAKDASSTSSTAQTALVVLVVRAIAASAGAGTSTASVSVAGATSQDLQYILEALHTSGYDAEVVGTTLTITWVS